MLTGVISPTTGEAWIGGYSIRDKIDKVHMNIGVCP
jgi:ABC-type multidrug transport system ATPase subunit